MASIPSFSEGRILAGVLIDEKIQFRYEVWAYRNLTNEELAASFNVWMQQRDRRRSLKKKLVQVIANHGMAPGL